MKKSAFLPFRLLPSGLHDIEIRQEKWHDRVVCVCGKTEKFKFDRGRRSPPSRCWWPAGWWEENVNSSGGLWLAGGGTATQRARIASKVLHWADQRAVQLHSDSPLRQVQRDKISLSLSVDRLAAKSAAFRVFVSFLSTLLPPSPSLLSRCDFRRGDYFRKGPRMSVVPLLASLLLLVVSPAAGQTGSDDPVTVDVGNRCIDDEGNPQVINRTLFFRTTLTRKPKSS